jgi:hypothetical protein
MGEGSRRRTTERDQTHSNETHSKATKPTRQLNTGDVGQRRSDENYDYNDDEK